MHLMFVPIVHTKDKEGKNIDKICARDFWKGRDSYRKLQDAYFNHVKSKGFDLERGMFIEDTGRKHYSIEEYKKITNYDNTKKILREIKLELPSTPNITDIKLNRLSKKRDEKILEEIIKPKDDMIKELYKDNLSLHKELSKQSKVIDEAQKYQKERDSIFADNRALHNQVENIKTEYKEKEFDIEWKYKSKIKNLEKENIYLHKVVDKFKEAIGKFIKWICKKFDMGAEDNLIRDFEKENRTCLDIEKQIKNEEREKEYEYEL